MAQGPRQDVMKYHGYVINKCRYQTRDHDDSRVTQNSGVSITAKTMQVAGTKDKNPVITDMVFYGVIQEIWMLDYFSFQIPLFKCDWVDSRNNIKVDELGFTSVELGRVGHKSDSFILASQAKQVFYVQDQLNTKWSLVLSTPQKVYYEEGNGEDFFDFCGDEIHANILPSVETFDVIDDSPSTYTREDIEGTWIDSGKEKC
jgi:hypothetical protein